MSIAGRISCTPERLHTWVRRTEIDTGRRGGGTSDERARMAELERENRELRRADEILRKASPFRPSGARSPAEEMTTFIDVHREEYGVKPICKVVPIAPSTHYEQKGREEDPSRPPERARRDVALSEEIQRVWEENQKVYGARKAWREFGREGVTVARCTVEGLMRRMGLEGAVRGKRIGTTIPEEAPARSADLAERDFPASRPNELWVADLTSVATWLGFVYWRS